MTNDIKTAAALTMDQLELMTVTQITNVYNTLAERANVKPIKKFQTKEQGLKRTDEVINLVRKQLEAEAAQPNAKRAKKEAAPKEKKVTVSGAIQGWILEGKTNDEIWELIQEFFGSDEKRKGYAQWNRSMMIRTGRITKDGTPVNQAA